MNMCISLKDLVDDPAPPKPVALVPEIVDDDDDVPIPEAAPVEAGPETQALAVVEPSAQSNSGTRHEHTPRVERGANSPYEKDMGFYPTPGTLCSKMLKDIDFNDIETILEPSAGKGDIAEAIVKHLEYSRRRNPGIDTIELDENLRHVLTGKEFRVVHSNFLTFHTFKKYGLIIMNPPFADGDKHLLKAIEIQRRHGGQIVCLLNAETLRTLHTNTRKDLARQLDGLGAEIEYMTHAFRTPDTERKTDVEVAIVRVTVPEPERISDIMEGLKRDTADYSVDGKPEEQMVPADYFERMIAQHDFEVRCGLKLIAEYEGMKNHIQESLSSEHRKDPCLVLKISDDRRYGYEDVGNAYVKMIHKKYWEALFHSDELMGRLTLNLRNEYHAKVEELQHYEFSMDNIERIKCELLMNTVRGVEATILAMFEKFSNEHSYFGEGDKNIHYYNGWKTNKAWIVNKRVIIPMYGAFGQYSWDPKFHPTNYDVIRKLRDIELVFNYLDMGRTNHLYNIGMEMHLAEERQQNRKIETKYFYFTFFKKGTCHIEFKDLDLLKKFNIFGSQRKGWLPPVYGKAAYSDMNTEERAVIDEFEGAESYAATMADTGYFLVEANDLLKLASGNNTSEGA